MAFCTSDHWLACLNSTDSISLINIETGDQTNSFTFKDTHNADVDACGHVVALCPTEYGECVRFTGYLEICARFLFVIDLQLIYIEGRQILCCFI